MSTAANRRTPAIVLAVVAAVLVVVALVAVLRGQGEEPSAAPADSSPATAAATAPPETHEAQKVVPASAPVELVVPHADPDLEIVEEVLPDTGPCDPIDPPTNDVYYCTDPGAGVQLPGTDSSDLAFLAGHSLRDPARDSPFDRIDDMGEEMVGKDVYVRTESSGDDWLVYSVEERIQIDQDDLAYSQEIWGDADGTTLPGRMLLITCHQTGDLKHSTDNTVLVAQLSGVVDRTEVDAALAA
jgi:Sortase domain